MKFKRTKGHATPDPETPPPIGSDEMPEAVPARTLADAMADPRGAADLTTEELAADAGTLASTWAAVQAANRVWIAAKAHAEAQNRALERDVAAKFAARQAAEAVHQRAAERLRLITAELETRA